MKKMAVILTSLSVFLAACGNSFISSQYQEIDTIENDLGDHGTVYQAYSKSVSEVASEIRTDTEPDHASVSSEEEMFLLYPEDSTDEVIHIMKDELNPANTIIEVVEEDFAENSYDFPLMETLGVLSVATTLYGWNQVDSKTLKKRLGYKGYVNAFRNHNSTSIPTNSLMEDEEEDESGSSYTGSGYRGTGNVKKSSDPDSIRNGDVVRGGGPGTGK
ncbi:DUF4247 domain-containing protein [Peribacillus sp. NPDC097264]|uniref:DUF4247 domain-containing protein n=1 Tax=Peribacillus sp. NPDC097264 TaxID=3390616 RepID=UPI003D05DA11